MPGGERRCAERKSLFEKRPELDPGIADCAGVGRAARLVFGQEVFNDGFAEGILQGENVMGDAEPGRHGPGVPDVLDRTAPAGARGQLKGEPEHVETPRLEQGCRDR